CRAPNSIASTRSSPRWADTAPPRRRPLRRGFARAIYGHPYMVTHATQPVPAVASAAASVLEDPSARAALDAIRRIVRALREESRASERWLGLSAAQLFVLNRLAMAPAVSVNELADR